MTLSTIGQVKVHRQPKVLVGSGIVGRLDDPRMISATIPVLLVFATLGFDKTAFGLPVPLASIALGCAVVGAAFIVPTEGLARSVWSTVLLLSIPLWMLVSTYLNHIGGTKRIANIGMLVLVVLVIASGRICVISVARGAALGVLTGTLWGFATFDRSSYVGRLTGGWGDPNNAGMCALVLGCVALAYTRTRRSGLVIAATTLACVIGTFSRTSLLALVIVIVWVAAAGRIKLWVRIAASAAVVWYVTTIPETEYTSSVFAGREGSDALRQRIDEATSVAVNHHPLYGSGAGTAQTTVQGGGTFFFHNSYQSLRAEGGWVLLAIVMALYAVLLVGLLRLPKQFRNHWIEASLLAALVCAVNLGEVFFAPPVIVAVGVAMRHIAVSRRRMKDLSQFAGEPMLGPPLYQPIITTSS